MTIAKKQIQLDADFVLMAYCNGYFPMAELLTGVISWYSPDPRAILPLDGFRISRSLRQRIRSQIYELRVNTEFERVIRSCAEREQTWISEEMVRVYIELHERGFAHSVESWHDGILVGGLYGVAVGGAFFGESMFSRQRDASKVALVHLVDRLGQRKFQLLDSQFMNEHIAQFGATEISRSTYLTLLTEALRLDSSFLDLK
ncbi:MAG: leucyl/phenylalanyl-tRNA--protein transferase [Ignavibacteria bacterium]|nr:leucyl/phenylalanyl-tRNA--protein transferase [Ignavibacteria bacterium]